MKIVGIPGSTRPNSFNRRFLEWIKTVIEPMDVSMKVIDIDPIPISMGFRSEVGLEVKKVKDMVSEAEGVIFSTPQYNYSFTQVLKNTIDWIAFPKDNNSWEGKKIYVVGVSMDSTGVKKAESKLNDYMQKLGCEIYKGESITIDRASEEEVFDVEGGLLDKKLEAKTKEILKDYVNWLK